jgi:hypothetical protein
VRRADFAAAVAAARSVSLDALDDTQRVELESALEQVYLALDGRGAALDACRLRVSLAEQALASEPTIEWQVRHARALHGVGYCQSVEALAAYDHVLTLYGASPEPRLQERVAKALVNKGFTLGALGQSEAEMAVYDEVERRFGSDERPGTREAVERAREQRKRIAEGRNDG